ncbi:alanine racemase [Ferrovibrio sp.]|uniref:alanine racemase n=1 Tax=Ferrovibrio sp. TaxID=1917215 RepID=UPI001B479A4C|nr:alanine racemase [Ferrovibrio sp.]MBP7063969.1 alanine racemase [Ferrovibrio sp.]
MTLDDLPTPSLILDLARLERNLIRMRERASALGVRLRPHLKTAKSARIAALAHGGEAGPVTVSTLAEAAYFAAAGFTDILYAVGIVPAKLAQAAAIMRQGGDSSAGGIDLKLITDDVATAQAIAAKGQELGVTFRVLIKIDTGLGRAGIAPDAESLLPLAAALNQPGAVLAGVLTHAGHSYHAHGAAEIIAIAEAERAGVVRAAERLRQAGHACGIVSVGSTPTALFAEKLPGITEMRPGNYVFFDLFQAGLGTCAMDDIAVSVLASVTGRHRGRNHLLIDAGGLALSKDIGANEHRPHTGYGLVCLPGGALPLPGLAVVDVHQEHGLIGPAGPAETAAALPFERFPVGSRLRVLPNHSCMTAAMYDRYYVVSGQPGDGRVIAEWDRINGW